MAPSRRPLVGLALAVEGPAAVVAEPFKVRAKLLAGHKAICRTLNRLAPIGRGWASPVCDLPDNSGWLTDSARELRLTADDGYSALKVIDFVHSATVAPLLAIGQ